MSLRIQLSLLLGSLSLGVAACGGGGSTPTTPGGPSTPTPTLTITISGAPTGAVGGTAQLTAQVRDSSGATVSPTLTWSSSDTAVASVTSSGLVSVAKIGPVTITASSGSSTGSHAFQGTLSPYTFDMGPTSATDQRIIFDAIQFAHTYFQSAFGRTLTQATTISGSTTAQGCAQGGGAAFTGARTTTFCVGNPGWTTHGPINRQKIAIHELYHLLQFEMGWLGGGRPTGAEWIIEGVAEFVGFQATAARGLLSFETTLGCMAKEVADFARNQPPGLPNLEQLAGPQQFRTTPGPLYALSLLGINQLAGGAIGPVRTYGEAMASGTEFPPAFSSAFGMMPAAFYAQWPSYLAGRPVPPSYLCGV